MKGVTLPELIISLAIISLLAVVGSPSIQRNLDRARVISATNNILGLIHLARSTSLSNRQVYLCDGHYHCDAFRKTNTLQLLHPRANKDGTSDLDVFQELTLPAKTHVQWKRFRGNALLFHTDGRTHFQNGHFLICGETAARKIVMNWAGRPRVETTPLENCS